MQRRTRNNRVIAILVSALLIASATLIWVAYAAEVVIDTDPGINPPIAKTVGSTIVFIDVNVGYAFNCHYIGPGSDWATVYRKTTDGGATWGSPVTVWAENYSRFSIWYDQWTPGDNSGNYIHIVNTGDLNDTLIYTRLDTSNDSLSAPIEVAAGQTPNLLYYEYPSITRGTDGDLYMGIHDEADSYVLKCSTTCTSSGNWAEIGASSPPLDFTYADILSLLPLSGGNIMAIVYDYSSQDLRSKVYHDFENSWDTSWVTIDANANMGAQSLGWAATVNKENNKIYLSYAANNATIGGGDDDIRIALYNGSEGWSPRTDVITNESSRGITDSSIAFDEHTETFYVLYTIEASPGTDTTRSVYYKKSSLGMIAWEDEVGPLNPSGAEIYGANLNKLNDRLIFAVWHNNTPGGYLAGSLISRELGCIIGGPTETCGDFEANAGSLMFVAVPGLENFGTGTVGSSPTTVGPYTFTNRVSYVDLRDAGPTGNLFTISVRATPFVSGANTFHYSGNFRIRSLNPPESLGGTNCSDGTYTELSLTKFLGTAGQPISDSIPLVDHAATNAAGTSIRQCRFRPVVDVTIPAFQSVGTYQTTLYWTIA